MREEKEEEEEKEERVRWMDSGVSGKRQQCSGRTVWSADSGGKEGEDVVKESFYFADNYCMDPEFGVYGYRHAEIRKITGVSTANIQLCGGKEDERFFLTEFYVLSYEEAKKRQQFETIEEYVADKRADTIRKSSYREAY